MGGFYGSTHIRTDSAEKVKDVLKTLCKKEGFKCYLSPSINGWVSVYNDMNGQTPLAETMAGHFAEDIISLLVHDDDFFCYWYYKNGKFVDKYNSCPDYFGKGEEEAAGGNPGVFRSLLGDKRKIKRLAEILALDEVKDDAVLPPEAKKEMAKMMKLNKLFEKINKDPMELLNFAKKNNIPLEGPIKKTIEDLVRVGMTLEQAGQHVSNDPATIQYIYMPVIEAMVKQCREDAGDSQQDETIEIPKRKQSKYFFAGEQLSDFAEALEIKNALTCYEYLQQGETDGIVDWGKFAKIP